MPAEKRAPPNFSVRLKKMPVGKRKRLDICRDCKRSNRPAITAARLGHANCLTTAYRELGVFNERDDFGATPIHFAARNGHLDCLKWLVTRSGVSPNAVARNGATAAHDAAAMGHLGCLHYLLENTPCTASDTTVEGATVLHMACRFGRLQVVKWLMDYTGASPGEKGANGVTPVHLCAAKNHIHCLQWLTRHHQYVPNERTVHGATAVYFAAQEGSVDCLQWLVKEASGDPHMMAEDGMSPVHAAAQAGHVPCLAFLISMGVSIRQSAEDGATPSHFAAASGQVETLEWILDNGGSVSDKDNLGGTPIHDAAEQGQVNTLQALISRGAPTHQEDYEGLKPLDLAKDNQHSECVSLLFKTVTPSLLTSITPRHSMTRASGADSGPQREAELEKQRQFESALLAGVSEERKEAMWSSAEQQAAMGPQPGLRLLLHGEVAASPSQFSLTHDPLLPPPPGSVRSRHSTRQSSRCSVKTIDDVDMMPYKPRPVLSPSLFDGPPQDTPEAPSADRPETKRIKTDENRYLNLVQNPAKEDRGLNVAKTPTHKASPIPQRAKFLRKFNLGGKKKISDTRSPIQEKGQSGVKRKTGKEDEGQVKEMTEVEEREDVTGKSGEKAQESVGAQQPVKDMKMAAMQAGRYTDNWTDSSNKRDSSNPYDMVAEELVSGALKDSLVAVRGHDSMGIIPSITLDSSTSVLPPPSPSPPSSPTHSSAVPNETSIVLREKPKHESVQEKAVIVKQKARKSLMTPDETVTVNFVPQQTNVKKSFPVTHTKLLKEDDLSSPGSTSDEETTVRNNSMGFENLDLENFEKFGQDIQCSEKETAEAITEDDKDISTQDNKKETDKHDTERKSEESRDASSKSEEAHFEEVATSSSEVVLGSKKRAASLGSVKPLAPPSMKKWDNMQSLERIGKSGEEMRELKSVMEEDEQQCDEEQQQTKDKELPDELSKQKSTNIQEFGSSAMYYKQAERGERKQMEVLKRVSLYEEEEGVVPHTSPVKTVTQVGLGVVKSGSVSEKLKMFGGGRKVTRTMSEGGVTMPQSTTAKTIKQETIPENGGEDEGDEVTPLPSIEKKLIRRSSEEKLRLDGISSLSPPRERRVDKPRESPPSSSKHPHHGTVLAPPLGRGSYASRSPPLGRLQEVNGREENGSSEVGGVGPSHSPTLQPKRRNSAGVYSPLMVSTDASDLLRKKEEDEKSITQSTQTPVLQDRPVSQERPVSTELAVSDGNSDTKRRSLRDERARRQLFALSADGKVGSRESAYMGWSPLPQTGQMKQRWEKEAGEGVRRRVENLLSPPRLAGKQVPFEFRGLQPRQPGRLTVWKQKAGSLQTVESLDAVTFEDGDVIIFLKEPVYGPILHHIYLWLGSGVSELSISSAHQHCQQLMHCLPGGCPLHKETQGHESGMFISTLGVGVASRLPGSTPYINSSLDSVTLYNLNTTFMSFQPAMAHPPSHSDLTASPSPSLLDTPTRVWVWLPAGYWGNQTGSAHYQKSVLDIGQAFIAQKAYPRWAPVTVLTQHCETLQFVSHFSTWPNLNFDLAPSTWKRLVRNLHLLELPVPTLKNKSSDMKIYRVDGSDRRPLPPVPSSHLSASGVYMFQWSLHHSSPIYMWVETAVCVWVGSRVTNYWEAVANCVKHVEKEMPLTLVPSGQEPPQLLSFFQGHMVVHASPHPSPHPSPHLTPHGITSSPEHRATRLYQVSGSSLEHIKAIEVPPISSSLCSAHCYILHSPPHLFSWSGHLSSEDTRTGALYIAQILNSSCKPLLVAEGQEEDDFWKCLGGKEHYQHFDSDKFPSWALPELYCCLPSEDHLSFTQLPPSKKRDLKSSGCYILWFKNQLSVWVGSQWKHHHFMEVAKAYISQCHSGCTARDFVVMVVHEGHEGEAFWQWFELQRCLEPMKDPSQDSLTCTSAKEEATPTNKQEVTPTEEQQAAPTIQPADQQTAELQYTMPTATVEDEDKSSESVKETGEEVTDGQQEIPPPASTEQPQADLDDIGAVARVTEESADDKEPAGSGTDAAVKEEDTMQDSHLTESSNHIAGSESMMDHMIPTPSVSSLLTQPEDLDDFASSKQKKRTKTASIKSPRMVAVSVQVEGGRTINVTMREGAPVISVMFRVAEMANLSLGPTSSLFEISPQLKLQCLLEEHEVMKDVTSQWPSGKQKPRLLLTTFWSKNMLWGTTPPISRSAITTYLETKVVPELTSELYYCPRATKLQWKKAKFQLGDNGLYMVSKTGELKLFSGLDHSLYTPTPQATLVTPTRFCFAMKPASSWKLKDVKLFCSSDLPTMAKWVHTIRLLQHGKQLKANTLAMRQRLEKREKNNSASVPLSLTK